MCSKNKSLWKIENARNDAEDSTSSAVVGEEGFWKKLPAPINAPGGCAGNLCRAEPLSRWFYGEDFGRLIAPKLTSFTIGVSLRDQMSCALI